MFKKSLAIFCGVLLVAQANAKVENPAYVELQSQFSTIDYKLSFLTNGVTARSIVRGGINFHLDIGYQFTNAVAAELGILWAYWPRYQGVLPPPGSRGRGEVPQNYRVKHNVLYLALKYGFSLSPRWEIYGKAGVGSVARDGFVLARIHEINSRLFATPVLGAGVLYRINARWCIDASLMEALPQSAQNLPAAFFVGIGARYQFTL